MTHTEAVAASKLVAGTAIFPEVKQALTRSLLDYYKALLAREPAPVPVVRRMWQ